MEKVQQYAELEVRRSELKDELTAVESQLKDLEPLVLEWFQAEGVQRIKIGERTLYLNRQIWAGRCDGVSDAQVVAALEGAGLSEFCGMKVNMQSLSAWMREREKEGQDPVPVELSAELRANEVHKVGSRRA
jgi:outer membrane biogenesis lipoprotein LolB